MGSRRPTCPRYVLQHHARGHCLINMRAFNLNGISRIQIQAAQALTATKATYVAVGNVGVLPYGDELGL